MVHKSNINMVIASILLLHGKFSVAPFCWNAKIRICEKGAHTCGQYIRLVAWKKCLAVKILSFSVETSRFNIISWQSWRVEHVLPCYNPDQVLYLQLQLFMQNMDSVNMVIYVFTSVNFLVLKQLLLYSIISFNTVHVILVANCKYFVYSGILCRHEWLYRIHIDGFHVFVINALTTSIIVNISRRTKSV